MSIARAGVLLFFFCAALLNSAHCQEASVLKRIRECFTGENVSICLKEKALDVLNETIMSDKPFNIYGFVDIIKDPNFKTNTTEEYLPPNLDERNVQLNKILYDKVEEFVESRSMKVNLSNIFEGERFLMLRTLLLNNTFFHVSL